MKCVGLLRIVGIATHFLWVAAMILYGEKAFSLEGRHSYSNSYRAGFVGPRTRHRDRSTNDQRNRLGEP